MSREPSVIASDPQVSAWVAANAGAGKTYTLANRVARLLLADAPPEKILCLTFTKAAAAEMQQRLFQQLGEWAMLPDDDLRARIVGIGGDAHAPLAKARRLFAAALETPGGLKVLTIHAFCQIVLSRFPIEAGIPPAFEVLDEATARALIAEARQHILERAGSGDVVLAAAVAHLVTETSENRLTNILDAALGGDRRRLDRFFAEAPDFRSAVRTAHGLAEGETAHGVKTNFCGALSGEIERLRETHGWLSEGSANDIKSAARLAAFLAAPITADSFGDIGAFLTTGEGEPRKQMATKKLGDARPDLLAWLTDLQTRYCAAAERHRAGRAADLAEAALTVVDAVRGHYRQAKLLRGVLDYDDLILKTRDLLVKDGGAAWVLYKLDGGIDHVLIDEAQDTSPEQWEIVRALTAEFFAGLGREHKAERTIFAVGDEKQSIFSFQGADPALFGVNRSYFAELAGDAGHPFIDQPLTVSRRSAPEILGFVDAVFAAHPEGLTSDGGVIAHQAHRAGAKGGIEFWPPLRPEEEEETDPYLPVDAVQKTSPVARLATQVADKIAGWLNNGARLPDHDRPIQPRDIMILLPRREPFGGEVIRQLKQRRIPVAGADRMRLTEQIAAMDLIALGRFVLQREDDLTLAALLRSPLCGLGEDALFALAHGRKSDLWRTLAARRDETPAFAAAHDFLSAMLARADYAPPFEFYSHALSALGAKEKLLARLGPESADAIDEFLSLALAHEAGHSPSVEGFLDWLERSGTEVKRDMDRGRNEVRVMTVHGAKGLEADIVILPDITAQPGGLNRHDGLLHSDGEVLFPLSNDQAPQIVKDAKTAANAAILNEHRRLLYVALTRARDRLYIAGFEGKRGAKDGSWYSMMRAAADGMDVKTTPDGMDYRARGTLEDERGDTATAASPDEILPDWINRPAPPEPALPRLIRPSDAGDGSQAFSPLGRGQARFRRGLVVHALLARLPETPPARRRDIALNFAHASKVTDAEALVNETLAVLDDPAFAAAFGPGSRAEAGLLADLPQFGAGARINGRIDRLAVSDDQVLILDFKTNRPPPASEADVAPITLAQMALYREGARAVFPGRRIVCGLVFTDGPRLLQLSDVVLDAQLAGIAARLAGNLDPVGARS